MVRRNDTSLWAKTPAEGPCRRTWRAHYNGRTNWKQWARDSSRGTPQYASESGNDECEGRWKAPRDGGSSSPGAHGRSCWAAARARRRTKRDATTPKHIAVRRLTPSSWDRWGSSLGRGPAARTYTVAPSQTLVSRLAKRRPANRPLERAQREQEIAIQATNGGDKPTTIGHTQWAKGGHAPPCLGGMSM